MMKKLCAAALAAVILMVGVCYAEECTTLGVKHCRASSPGVCYWWECQQTGSVTQMIFLGQKCDCPKSEADTGNCLCSITGRER